MEPSTPQGPAPPERYTSTLNIVPPRRSPQRNINPATQAYDAHDNDVHDERVEDNNNENVAATDGNNRPELHVHEGQAGGQPPEVVDDDKHDVDVVEDEKNDHDMRVEDDK